MATDTMRTEHYVVDAQGNRVAVQLELAEYERLLKELEELRAALVRERLGVVYYPPAPDASVEKLREAMGVFRTTRPVLPLPDLFDDEDSAEMDALSESDARD